MKAERLFRVLWVVLGAVMLATVPASATDYVWTGVVDTDWQTPDNWSGGTGGYPFDTMSQADTATIDADAAITNMPKAVLSGTAPDINSGVMKGTIIVGNGTDTAAVSIVQGGTGFAGQVGAIELKQDAELTLNVWYDYGTRMGGITGVTNKMTMGAGSRFSNPGKDFYVRGTYIITADSTSNMTVGQLYFTAGVPSNPWTFPWDGFDSAVEICPNGGKVYLNAMTTFNGSYFRVASNPAEMHFDAAGANTLSMPNSEFNLGLGNCHILMIGADDTIICKDFLYDTPGPENITWTGNKSRIACHASSVLEMRGSFTYDPTSNYTYDRITGMKVYETVGTFRFAGAGTIKSGTRQTTLNGPELWHAADFVTGAFYQLRDTIYSDGGDLTLDGLLTSVGELVDNGIIDLNGFDLVGFTASIVPPSLTFSVEGSTTHRGFFTNSATVDATMIVEPGSGTITGYLINEDATAPALDDLGWQPTLPTSYEITGPEGDVTIYAWVKDSNDRLAGASDTIGYATGTATIIDLVTSPRCNTIYVTWETDVEAVCWIMYGVQGEPRDMLAGPAPFGVQFSLALTDLFEETPYELEIHANATTQVVTVATTSSLSYTWTDEAEDGDWRNPANWSGGTGGYPFDTIGDADTATIAVDARITNMPKVVESRPGVPNINSGVLKGTLIIGDGVNPVAVSIAQGGTGIPGQVGAIHLMQDAELTMNVWYDWPTRLGGITGVTNKLTMEAGSRFSNPGKELQIRGTYVITVDSTSNMTVGLLCFGAGSLTDPWTFPWDGFDSAVLLCPTGTLILNGMTTFNGPYFNVQGNPFQVRFDATGANTLSMPGTDFNVGLANGQILMIGADDTIICKDFLYDTPGPENITWDGNTSRIACHASSVLEMHGSFTYDSNSNYTYNRTTGKQVYESVGLFRFAGAGTIKSGTRDTTVNGPEKWHAADFGTGASYQLLDDVYSDGGDLTLDGQLTNSRKLVEAGVLDLNGFNLIGFNEISGPAVTFAVTDATSGSTLLTNDATVAVELSAQPADESTTIAGYMITESDAVPPADDPGWLADAPTSYTIIGGVQPPPVAGGVTLYAWALDSAGNIGGATASILFSTAVPVVSNVVVVDNADSDPPATGTATATWDTDIPAEGSVKYGAVSLSGTTPNSAIENAVGLAHSVTFAITAGTNYKIIPVNNEIAGDAIYWPLAWPIEGDANGDCRVNILDLIFIRNKLNQDVNTGDNWKADVNEDTRINILDLIFVRNKLNTSCPL